MSDESKFEQREEALALAHRFVEAVERIADAIAPREIRPAAECGWANPQTRICMCGKCFSSSAPSASANKGSDGA